MVREAMIPGHIAHVLQNGQQEEQHQHLRHEAQHRAHTGHNAVLDQPVEPAAFGHTQSAQNGVKQAGDHLTEEDIIGPVSAHRADGNGPAAHGNGVDAEHDQGEDGQGQDPVGDDLVDLVGDGEAVLRGFLPHRAGYHSVDVSVPLIGDDTLRVIIHLPLTIRNVFLKVCFQAGGEIQFLQNLFIPLKNFNGIPA